MGGHIHKLYDHVVQGGWEDTHTNYMTMWYRVVGRTHKLYDHVVQGGWKDTHTHYLTMWYRVVGRTHTHTI